MGGTLWLDRIDPDTWARACQWLADNPLQTHDEVLWFVGAFERQPTASFLLAIDDDYDDPERLAYICNRAFELAVTEERWDLDVSFRLFAEVPRWVAELAPLGCVGDGRRMDIDLPTVLRVLDSGLRGCLSPPAQQSCAQTLERFPTVEEVRAALQRTKPGALSRLRGKRSSAALLAERLQADYYERMWSEMVAAFRATGGHGHYLGVGMAT
jgi:hypothetical protein